MVAPSDSLDNLLSELEQTFQTHNPAMQNPDSDRNLDDALSAFQQQPSSSAPPPRSPATDALLSDLLTEFDQKQQSTTSKPAVPSATDAALAEFAQQSTLVPPPDPATDSALDDFAQSFTQKQAATPLSEDVDLGLDAIAGQFQAKPKSPAPPNLDRALDSQAQQMQRQKHAAWTAQQYRLKLEKKARQWLETLDPYSNEGLWFTEFASYYPSKLDAAMEYLDTLLAGNQQGNS